MLRDFLESPALTLLALLLFALGAMGMLADKDSLTMDELAHIPAGYGYVHELDFRLNPEHPPLLKALSALPLALSGKEFPTNSPAWTSEINGQWDMGREFIYGSGNNANALIFLARQGPILITLLLILSLGLWGISLLGPRWGLLPAILLAFSPTILAHGHYVTTDISAALGFALSIITFLRAIERPSVLRILLSGLAFGIAQSSKFSAVLLVPVLGLIALAAFLVRFPETISRGKAILRAFGIAILTGVIGIVFVVYPLYAVFVSHYPIEKQTADTISILGSFAGGAPGYGEDCHGLRCAAEATIELTRHKITRPLGEYALGILMVMQRSEG